MKFSIITVSYNAGDKLWETLESVASQTCKDYEIIVKDGGSTDGSTDFLRKMGEEKGNRAENSADFVRKMQEAGEDGADSSVNFRGELRKDGNEDSRERIKEDVRQLELSGRLRFTEGKDAGIYDAMNQAVKLAAGDYILFLNCGDTLADREVLARTAAVMENAAGTEGVTAEKGTAGTGGAAVRRRAAGTGEAAATESRYVFYGDTLGRRNGVTIVSPPRIDGFACYRNIPCHQSCFYNAALCREKPFDLRYRIRADYEHFLWCFYQGEAEFIYLGYPVSSYEGGGYSESRENVGRDRQEHRQIVSFYMGQGELLRYRTAMALTLAPLRRRLADSRAFSGLYHRLKGMAYRGKKIR